VLIRQLLGSPALVGKLRGIERVVAVKGYEDALKGLWIAGAGLAALMVLVQAGTGWRGAKEERLNDEDERLVEENEREE